MRYRIFIEMKKLKQREDKILKFITDISTKVTFAADLALNPVYKDEYIIAVKGFEHDYQEDSMKKEHIIDEKPIREDGVEKKTYDYLDIFEEDDKTELEQACELLKKYIEYYEIKRGLVEQKTEQSYCVKYEIPQGNFVSNRYTYKSHCTIGGIYRQYEFHMTPEMIDFLIKKNDLLGIYTYENIGYLDDPGFYQENRLVASICTHEEKIVLKLNQDEYNMFKGLGLLDPEDYIDNL